METSCYFRFGFWDVTAREDATLTASQSQAFANPTDVNTEDLAPPATITLEPDFGWPLDGSVSPLPLVPEETQWGWWSQELSGADGAFANTPVMTVTFADEEGTPTPHSSIGITLEFQGSLPSQITVTWLGESGETLEEATFAPDGLSCAYEKAVENYYQVVVTIHGMAQPYRYLRMTGIVFGLIELLSQERITSATLTEEVDPSLLTLPVSQLSLSFYTQDGRFALLNLDGVYSMFQWSQEIKAYQTVDGIATFLGTYYLQEATATVDAVTTLTCVNGIGLLDAVEFDGGLYQDAGLADLLDEILTPEGLSFSLDDVFVDTTLSGYLPICTRREALQQLAFAVGAVVNCNRQEAIVFAPLPEITSGEILPFQKVLGHTITLESLVTQVDVSAHQYTLSSDATELVNCQLEAGTHRVLFSQPAKITSVNGATLEEEHINFCVLSLAEAGDVLVSGYAYEDSPTVYTAELGAIPAGVVQSVLTVSDATLVCGEKASTVAQRLCNFYQNRYLDEGDTLPLANSVGQQVAIHSFGEKTMMGYLQQMITDLYGGGIHTIQTRGTCL